MWWLGAVYALSADGPAAHLDHVLLSIMDGLGADLVYTHVDHMDVVARTAMTARLRSEPSPAELAALEKRLTHPEMSPGHEGHLHDTQPREGHLQDTHQRREGHLRDIPPREGHDTQPRREGHLRDTQQREGHLRAIPHDAGPPDGARCVRFPGQERFTGVVPAIELVAHSAIDEVVGIGVPVEPHTLVDTRGFLRPTYTQGRLVLLVEPAAGGVLRPVEIEQPHQCCGGH